MWLQDLIKPGMNAAENIPINEALAFQQQCKLSAGILLKRRKND